MSSSLSVAAIERGLIEAGVPIEKARERARQESAGGAIATQRVTQKAESGDATVRAVVRRATHAVEQRGVTLATGRRLGDRLHLELPYPPRTKKNGGKGGFGGIRQREAYRRFRAQVVNGILPLTQALRLPLPERCYNIAATYYVDRGGEKADKCGLDQGLYDALENAGVVTNDWQFRTDDGTRIVAGDPHPRVELTITPIEEVQDGGQ